MVDSSHIELRIRQLCAYWFPSGKKSTFAIHPYINPVSEHANVFNIYLSLQFSDK